MKKKSQIMNQVNTLWDTKTYLLAIKVTYKVDAEFMTNIKSDFCYRFGYSNIYL